MNGPDFSGLPGWSAGIRKLHDLLGDRGAEAKEHAAGYGEMYAGARGLMVFDVVMSRQRKYRNRVLPLIEKHRAGSHPTTLRELAKGGPMGDWPFREGERQTVEKVALGLARYCTENSLDEESGVKAWAASNLEHAFRLDPHVGGVAGLGLTLYCYLRMRCGARDTVKPDLRVGRALDWAFERRISKFGPNAILQVALAAAEDLSTEPIVLDQLLWVRMSDQD